MPLEIPKGDVLAVDTEGTGVKVWHGDEPFAISFCNEEGETGYVEWPVDPFTRVVAYDGRERDYVAERLLDPKLRIVMHNAKYDVRMLANIGIDLMAGDGLAGRLDETFFMAQIADTLEGELGLKPLAQKYLEVPLDDQTNLLNAVRRIRGKVKKLGWALAYDEKPQEDGTIKLEAAPEADYWMPAALKREEPALWKLINEKSPLDGVCEAYACKDAERTMLLRLLYLEILEERGCKATYQKELDLWPVVYRLEARGVRLDRTINDREEAAAIKQLLEHKRALIAAAWPGFNPKSDVEMRRLLYDEEYLGLEVLRRTDKKKLPATNTDAIHDYEEHPIVQHLVKMRAAHKGWSSFFRKYRKFSVLDPEYGGFAIHTDFQQIGPVTGRFSSRTPNLQNVANALTTRSSEPIQARTPYGPRKHRVVHTYEGNDIIERLDPFECLWFHWDYHQVEVRIFADVAQEPLMLDAIRNGRDLHTECTNKAWGGQTDAAIRAAAHSLELDGSGSDTKSKEVLAAWNELGLKASQLSLMDQHDREKIAATWMAEYGWDIVKAEKSLDKKTSRAKAKMLLFAKQFGGGPKAVKDLLRVSHKEAAQFLADYDTAFPRIPEYIDEIAEEARANGFILNCYGDRLSVNGDKAYRACNYKVQGSAARLIKNSMLKVNAYLQEIQLKMWMILTIHDELAFEAWKGHAKREVIRNIGMIMADNDGAFTVPTPVELSMTHNSWDKKEDAPWCKGLLFADGTMKDKT